MVYRNKVPYGVVATKMSTLCAEGDAALCDSFEKLKYLVSYDKACVADAKIEGFREYIDVCNKRSETLKNMSRQTYLKYGIRSLSSQAIAERQRLKTERKSWDCCAEMLNTKISALDDDKFYTAEVLSRRFHSLLKILKFKMVSRKCDMSGLATEVYESTIPDSELKWSFDNLYTKLKLQNQEQIAKEKDSFVTSNLIIEDDRSIERAE